MSPLTHPSANLITECPAMKKVKLVLEELQVESFRGGACFR